MNNKLIMPDVSFSFVLEVEYIDKELGEVLL